MGESVVSQRTLVEVSCDGCGLAKSSEFKMADYQFLALLKRDGWNSHGHWDYCPDCATPAKPLDEFLSHVAKDVSR